MKQESPILFARKKFKLLKSPRVLLVFAAGLLSLLSIYFLANMENRKGGTSDRVTTGANASNSYQGFGSHTAGGNNGAVVHVTNLNDSGPGSLRDAVSTGNRNIVFDVSGVITFTAPLQIRNLTNITVDGSTAPAPGITLTGHGMIIRTARDIIITHLRIRDTAGDGILVWDSSENIVLDHNSVTNGGDETLSITEDTKNITVSWNIIGDTRSNWPDVNTKGTLVTNFTKPAVTNLTLHHNLWTNQFQRSPQISTAGLFDMRNNVIREWASYGTRIRAGAYGNIINNVYQSARKPQDALAIIADGTADAGPVHVSGNTSKNGVNLDSMSTHPNPHVAAPVTTDPVSLVEAKVLAGVGAMPRDVIDTALVGTIPESPNACADGQDNDGDNLVDYPNDPGCSSTTDSDESNSVPPSPTPTPTPIPANQSPTAGAGPDQTVQANQEIVLNGSATDPDNDPLSFSWNLGDGTTKSGKTITHIYASPGIYTATLSVNDGRGGNATDNAIITVSPVPTSAAPITRDTVSNRTFTKVSTLSWQHTTNGKDRLLTVAIGATDTNRRAVTSISYNGKPLTKINRDNRDHMWTELWYIVNPALGTNTITVNLSGTVSHGGVAGATSLTGVRQINPLGSIAKANTASRSISTTVPATAPGSWILDTVVAQDDPPSVGQNQTMLWSRERWPDEWVSQSSEISTGGNVTMSSSWSRNNRAAMVAAEFKASAGTAAAPSSSNNWHAIATIQKP
jgi:pectate lyase